MEDNLGVFMAYDYSFLKQNILNQINKVLCGSMERGNSVLLFDHTPNVLQSLGLADLPILFSQNHVRNCLHEKGKNPHWHGLSALLLSDLPKLLDNPVIVYDSLSNEDSIVVVLNEVDSDNYPIIASIRANGEGMYQFEKISSNYLTSVYGHEHLENIISRTISCDSLLFVDKKQIQELSIRAQLPLLRGIPLLGFNNIIHQSNNIINNQQSENQEIREEIISMKNNIEDEERTVSRIKHGR